jgi:transglutaminase-like putative cysteine protease
MAAALLFWGWQTGYVGMAVGAALLLEARRLVPYRFEFDHVDFNRGADLCLLLVAGAAVWLFLTPRPTPIYLDLSLWAPLFLLPLAVLQAYARTDRVRLLALLPSPRPSRRARALARKRGVAVNLNLVYMGLCLLSAGMANVRTPAYYLTMLLLAGYLLWFMRPRRHRAWAWALTLLAAGVIGWGGQYGLDELQQRVRNWARHRYDDPFKAITGIGDLGELKLSQNIALRVAVPQGMADSPPLLRQAVYDFYGRGTWQATNATFTALTPEPNRPGRWVLATGAPEPDYAVTVYQYFPRAKGLLALPAGTVRLAGMPAELLERNRMGAVQVDNAPGLAGYRAAVAPGVQTMAAPTYVDRVVPPSEQEAVNATASALGLEHMEPGEALRAVAVHFREGFEYTLRLDPGEEAATPITHFLTTSRAGHCEYFATAATLVLRHVGIPARYAMGYSLKEVDPATGMFLVRYSHAHSWVEAWVDGAWRTMDPTPAVWLASDVGEPDLWRRIADWRARMAFRFSRWRWLSEDDTLRHALLALTIPLGLFLLWRMRRRGGVRRVAREGRRPRAGGPGAESPFYRVLETLERKGARRPPSRPVVSWLAGQDGLIGPDREELLELAELHYRWRFDPAGLGPEERRRLEAGVARWLERNR